MTIKIKQQFKSGQDTRILMEDNVNNFKERHKRQKQRENLRKELMKRAI